MNSVAAWMLSNDVTGALARACWQGGLFVFAVWLVCRLLGRRLPARARFALWWLACLKLIVGLFWAGPTVPLPAAFPVLVVVPRPARFSPAPPAEAPRATFPAAAAPSVASPAASPAAVMPLAPVSAAPHHAGALIVRSFPWGRAGLLLMWLVGVAVCWGASLRQALALQRLLKQHTRPLSGERAESVRSEARRLAHALKLARVPDVRESDNVGAPLVTGALRPVIVVPADFAAALSPGEVRMALAHELAHVRRGDLWLGLLPALARTLFFFFPPVWLACRECAVAREEDCDARALQITGARPEAYGRMLLRIIAGDLVQSRLALGITSPGFRLMRRRLVSLQREAGSRKLALLFPALGLVGLAPWRASSATETIRPTTGPVRATRRAPAYAFTDLPTLGGNFSHAYAISDNGRIVGTTSTDQTGRSGGRAFLYDDDTDAMNSLGVLARTRRSVAFQISDNGQIVVGTSFSSSARFPHAMLWRPQRGRRYLSPLPGYQFSQPLGVSDAGWIVGAARSGGFRDGAMVARAFLFDGNTTRDLGTLGGRFASAHALNNAGQIVGKADRANNGGTHAFLWQSGVMTDLGTLPGGTNSFAHAINDAGQVVGFSQTADSPARAFVWNAATGMRDLGTLPGDGESRAYCVSPNGVVVGVSQNLRGSARAVLWRADGTIVDLNNALPAGSPYVLTHARGINAHGQIVGQGMRNGQVRAFLLTPLVAEEKQ